jgi:metal-responsive CopG/Arc/MetJ family transcriptional regulator
MVTTKVVLDAKPKTNRSALIRCALQEHLKRLQEMELEAQDLRGYLATPQRDSEVLVWEDAAAWPAD